MAEVAATAEDPITTGEQAVAKLTSFPYPKWDATDHEIDMVMKGGITSGVVYPLAVCQLATTRRFRNVGGTSAGGIAAGMAAVAELGRDNGGYNRLAELPNDLGTDLLAMFQPSPGTKPLFDVLLAGLDKEKGKTGRALGIVAAVVKGGAVAFAVAMAAIMLLAFWGIVLAAGAPHHGGDWGRIALALVFVLPPALLIAVLAAVAGLALTGKKRLEANGYGLCIGSAGTDWPTAAPATPTCEPFADWLHAKLNVVAGVERHQVLTFGDLWGPNPADPRVRLEMMTTNVTFCRPERLPFHHNKYFFCPTELRRYFPVPVVQHLLDHGPPSTSSAWHCPDHGDELRHVPPAEHLPVMLAVRMTLSFPGLISAVPLFAIDRAGDHQKPVRCWFSDGGVSSNFPIHFFDSLWPRRPTFGISLSPYPPDRERRDVYLRKPSTTPQPRVRSTTSLLGFVASLLDTLQNWSDEGQSMLQGYSDRIVEVHHEEDEGGMNLNMRRDQIMSMCLRGYKAALALDAFDFGHHRDVRYRTAMAQLDRAVRDMARKYDLPLPNGEAGYRQIIGHPGKVARTDTLLTLAGRPPGPYTGAPPVPPPPDFTADEPKPVPDLRIVTHF